MLGGGAEPYSSQDVSGGAVSLEDTRGEVLTPLKSQEVLSLI